MYWIYIWLGVMVLSLILEAVTSELVSIWFAGGSVVALILAIVGVNFYVQIAVFVVLSLILLLCFRKIALERLNKNQSKTNAEAIVGKTFVLLSPIKFDEPGTIRVNDVIWNAVTEKEGEEVEAGKKVKIKEIKGNKYIVEVIENE